MCVRVSGLGVGDIAVADTGVGDVERVIYGRRARAYVGNGEHGVRGVAVVYDLRVVFIPLVAPVRLPNLCAWDGQIGHARRQSGRAS